jgi:hypothetical protein
LTLWNPTIHPVTVHPRVPVTREYLIRDPIGNLVPAEVHHQRCMTKTNRDFSYFLSYSIFRFHTQRKVFLVERVLLRISIYFKHHCPRLVTVPIISKRKVRVIEVETMLQLFVTANAKKIKHEKVITTINEACVLQNEVGHEFRITVLTD